MADWSNRAAFEGYYKVLAEKCGRPNTRPPIYLHYNDWHYGEGQRRLAANLKDAASLVGPAVVIGAGFGWTVEGLLALGVTAIGTDISGYIHSAKLTSEEADIRDYCARAGVDPDTDMVLGPSDHPKAVFSDNNWWIRPLDWWLMRSAGPRTAALVIDEDSSTNPSRRAVQLALGSDIAHIVTEELLNSVDDATALTVCDYIEQARTSKLSVSGCTVHHMLSPLQPGGRQSPDLNWKTYADWRAFLDAAGFAHHKIVCTVAVEGRAYYEVM